MPAEGPEACTRGSATSRSCPRAARTLPFRSSHSSRPFRSRKTRIRTRTSTRIRVAELLRPHRHHRKRQRRARHARHVGQRDYGQRLGADAQSEVLSQAVAADLRAVAHADRTRKHAAVTANGVKWKEVPTLYQQAAGSECLHHAESARRQHRRPLRRRRRRRHAAYRTEQHSGQLPRRLGRSAATSRAGSITTLIDRPLGVSGVNNPQAATGGQDAQSVDDIRVQCAALRADARPRRLHHGLSELRAQLCRHRQSLCHLDSQRAGARRLPHRRRGRWRRPCRRGNPTLDNLDHVAAQLRQPADPDSSRSSFLETLFGSQADIKYDPAYDAPTVKQQRARPSAQQLQLRQHAPSDRASRPMKSRRSSRPSRAWSRERRRDSHR